MGMYLDDLKKNNPAKYADVVIAGNQDKVSLRNMVKALSMMQILNSPEENLRLAAAKRLLRNRY